MSDIQIIETAVSRAARRRRFQRAWRGMWIGLFVAACVWLTVLGIYKLAPLPERTMSIAAIIALTLLPVGFLMGLGRGVSLVQAARWVDDQQHFQERLSTALEMATSEKAGRWRELLLIDAAEHARRFDVRKSIPLHLPGITRWSLLIL